MSEPCSDETKPKVLLTCTTTGQLRRETASSLLVNTRDPRYEISVSLMNDRPYASALNRAARDAMAADMDWWLHIDSDQYWMGSPLDSIEANLDLVGFPAPIWHPGEGPGAPVMCFNAWHTTNPADWDSFIPARADGKMKRVDCIGSGSFLMKVTALREAAIPAPFLRRFDVNGIADRGVDMEMCRKWNEAGLLIHANFACICGHFQTVDLAEVMQDLTAVQAQVRETTGGEPENHRRDESRIVGA